MLFDLRSGRRRRVVQVVFSFLALIFAVGFIGFGIGGEISLNPADLFNGGGGTASSTYDEQIERAEQTLDEEPNNERALLNLAEYRYLAARESFAEDEQGRLVVTEEASTELGEALDAWEAYLATEPRNPDVGAARQLVQAYVNVEDFGGAAETQEIIAEQEPNLQDLYYAAFYNYAAGDTQAGKRAGEEALAEASGQERKQLERALEQLEKQAAAAEKQAERQREQGGEDALGEPFGGLEGGGGVAPPTTP